MPITRNMTDPTFTYSPSADFPLKSFFHFLSMTITFTVVPDVERIDKPSIAGFKFQINNFE